MALDSELLATARAAAEALHRGETGIAPLREDYRNRLRALHAGGASLREIGAALGLSHQRVHQLVQSDGVGLATAPYGRPRPLPVATTAVRACCLCGATGEVRMARSAPVCAACARVGRALLGGRGEGDDGGLRLLRRHQRPHCSACGRLPEAGEAFLAGPLGAICPECLDR